MAMTIKSWPPERREEAARLTREHGIQKASRLMGYDSDAPLRGMFRHYGVEWKSPPPPPVSLPAAPPGAVAVSGPVEGLDWRGSRPQTPPTGIERRLNIGDLHIPAHDARALACVYAIIRAIQPHKVYQLGDLLNAHAFTHHGATSPRAERVDLATMAARAFVRSVKRAAPGAELIIVKGNHDGWSERWEAENPAFEGSFDFETMLGLRNAPDDDRPPMFEGVRVVRHSEKSGHVDGPIAYCHGTGGGMHCAKRYAENIGPRTGVKHIRFAHHHTDQVFVHKNGIKSRCVGWLGNEDHESNAFRYAPPPRGWWVGVSIDDVSGDFVTTTDIEIRNGVAFFGGRLIAP